MGLLFVFYLTGCKIGFCEDIYIYVYIHKHVHIYTQKCIMDDTFNFQFKITVVIISTNLLALNASVFFHTSYLYKI